MATVRPGEGVFQEIDSGRVVVRRDEGFEEVKEPIRVVRPGMTTVGTTTSGRPPLPTETEIQISEEAKRLEEQARIQEALRQIPTQEQLRRREIFDPRLDLFARPSEPSGQATAQFRPPTIQEAQRIRLAQERGRVSNILKQVGVKVEEGFEKARELPGIRRARQRIKETGIVERIESLRPEPVQTTPSRFDVFTTPKGVRSLFLGASELTLRGGEALATQAEKRGLVTDPLLLQEAPISRETARELIADLFTFSTFSPLISTGAAKKGSAKQKIIQKEKAKKKTKKKITREDIKDYLKTPEVKGKEVKTIGKGLEDYQTKAERARFLLQSAKGPEGRLEAIKLIRQSYGDDFLKEFVAQGELGVFSSQVPKTVGAPKSIIEAPAVPRLQRLESVLFAQEVATTQKQKQKPMQLLRVDTRQTSIQDVAQLFAPAQRVDTRVTTTQAFTPAQATKQDSFLGSATSFLETPRVRQPTPKPKPRPKPKPKQIVKKKTPMLDALKAKGYIAQVKEKGEWKDINPKRPLSKSDAKRLGKKVADVTISASTRTRPTNKPAKKALKKLVDLGFKFRQSKNPKTPGVLVEKRKFRLDTKSETQSLKQYKQSAEFRGLFKKKKKKKRKKKKSTGINWFS